jgi:hypothetical protein
VCAAHESSDGEGDSVANRPTGQGEERVEEEAEPELMRRMRRAKERHLLAVV